MAGGARTGRRVVLTGAGVLSSIGFGVREFAAGLRAGRSGVRPIERFDTTGFDRANGCEIPDFQPAQWIHRLDPATLGRAAQFAVGAAGMAVADAGLTAAELRDRRGVVCVGTTDGGSGDLEQIVTARVRSSVEPETLALQRIPASTLSSSIARELQLSDVDVMTVATACAAGNYAIGSGFDAVRSGAADYALCGGADGMCRTTFTGFYRLRSIAPDVPRPFDVDRAGILTGEGAGLLLLEPLERARARGARIYAEILGYGLDCDARHQVAPDRSGVARCMRIALADAEIRPSEVDLISAHGTGTKANDVTEVGAIREVFGERPPRTVSMKSMLGHTMGAATALAAIGSAVAITERFIPPTINHRHTDPDCPIDCVPNEAAEAELRVVQNNGLAFGGNNAVVLLGRFDG
jgi:3-oxoacyl-[acyl-carrier-protein] synthase II